MKSTGLFIATVALALFARRVDAAEVFECRWAATPPVIDGRLDDPVWQHAQVIESFQSAWLPEGQRKPPTVTKARLLWDREYLYFAAEMEDADLFADVTEHDGPIWKCDVFELFFKPAKDKPGYYEFEVNAANGKLDMFLPERTADGYTLHKSDRDFNLDSAVDLRGTLNQRTDRDRGWSVEGRIPWRDFLVTGGRPVPGEQWQHALCRYDYNQAWKGPALSSTAPLGAPSFHRFEDYVPLKFVGPYDGAVRSRPVWNTSRLVGSPEPPLPFAGVPAFPHLRTKQPIMIAVEPGRNSFLLLECNGYAPVRTGRVSRLPNNPEAADPEVLLDLNESIYDVCFHPNFAENGYVYLGANGRFGEGKMDFNCRVLRYTMDRSSGRIDPASRRVILEWQSQGHNGMALTFGRDGMLYVTSGDGTSDSDEWDSGQDLTRLLAKLLRIDVDHPAPGQRYGIPPDNPFLTTRGARPETWAYGFRNPWRMTMDRATGDLWVGENGQDLWEYARIARRGENYGWPIVEGSHEFHQNRRRGPTPITKPLIEHPHTDFRSLTGGIVYRGAKFADLFGCYVYGDHSTGQIWAAKQENGKLLSDVCIADTTLGITGFCETPQGDILVVDYLGSAIHKLERAPPPPARQPFPRQLSETGLFSDTSQLKPHSGLIPYEVNAPAWHDGAASVRHLALPRDARMEVTEKGGWNLPNGSAVVQTLILKERRVETRVMLRQENEWTGYTYVWNDAQTDATLMSSEGETRPIAGQTWRIPGKQECLLCHSRAANFLLGVSTVQLNRGNQIAEWERTGILASNPGAVDEAEWRRELEKKGLAGAVLRSMLALISPSEAQRPPPKNSPLLARAVEALPRIANPHDTVASLNERARAYLHANCSHCHARNAGGNSLMQLASDIAEENMSIFNVVPMHATFGIEDARIVAPGSAPKSVMVHRTVLRGPGQMPPVGTMLPDGAGVNLLAQWIESLSKESAPPKTEKP
jgi:glucose/arabinose dehydrogenase